MRGGRNEGQGKGMVRLGKLRVRVGRREGYGKGKCKGNVKEGKKEEEIEGRERS